jgi:hypothetical protein
MSSGFQIRALPGLARGDRARVGGHPLINILRPAVASNDMA